LAAGQLLKKAEQTAFDYCSLFRINFSLKIGKSRALATILPTSVFHISQTVMAGIEKFVALGRYRRAA